MDGNTHFKVTRGALQPNRGGRVRIVQIPAVWISRIAIQWLQIASGFFLLEKATQRIDRAGGALLLLLRSARSGQFAEL